MEKGLVQKLQQAIPAMFPLLIKEEHVVINFDKEADILYVSFGNPQKADGAEMINKDLLVRKKGKKIVGITILHFTNSSFFATVV